MLFCGVLCVCKTSRNTSVIPKWEEAKGQSRKEKVGAVEWNYPFKWGERYRAGLDTQRPPIGLYVSFAATRWQHMPALVLASQSVLGFGQTQGPRPRNSLPYFLCSSTLPIYGWSLGTLQFCFVLLFQMNPAGEGTLLVKCGVVAQQHPRVLKQGRHSMPQHK